MKNIHMLVVLIALLTTPLIACSPDREEQGETKEESILTPEPILKLEPDWADGVMTITTGNFESSAQLAKRFERESEIRAGKSMMRMLKKDLVRVSQQKGTIEIVVMALREAGFDEPATIEEIRERYRELGYRPMTLQEAAELRLQFWDQPDAKTGHKMSSFFVLLSEKESEVLGIQHRELIFCLYRNTRPYRQDCVIGLVGIPKKIDPHSPEISFSKDGFRKGDKAGTRFAGVVIK